jgi:hypothetical protein
MYIAPQQLLAPDSASDLSPETTRLGVAYDDWQAALQRLRCATPDEKERAIRSERTAHLLYLGLYRSVYGTNPPT